MATILRLRKVATSVALMALLISCASATPAAEEPAGSLQVGWNEIAAAPYPAGLREPVAFWTGSDLLVAGGFEWPEPYVEVINRPETYAYSLESGTWRELEPLAIPGYDGIRGFAGAWTGAAWIGVGFPCKDGRAEGNDSTMGCDRLPIGLRWTPEDGWSSTGPVPAESMSPDRMLARLAGQTSIDVVLATSTGYLSQALDEGADGSWRFTPWPSGAEPLYETAACVVGDIVMTVSTVLRPAGPDLAPGGDYPPDAYPQSLSINKLTPEGQLSDSTFLIDLPHLFLLPYCQRGQALYVYTTPGGSLFQINAEGTVELPVDTRGSMEHPAISVSPAWIDVDTGVVNLREGPGSYYLDGATGAVTTLQPVPAMNIVVWTGQVLFTSPGTSSQWFAFLPQSSWAESGNLDFPFTVKDD